MGATQDEREAAELARRKRRDAIRRVKAAAKARAAADARLREAIRLAVELEISQRVIANAAGLSKGTIQNIGADIIVTRSTTRSKDADIYVSSIEVKGRKRDV